MYSVIVGVIGPVWWCTEDECRNGNDTRLDDANYAIASQSLVCASSKFAIAEGNDACTD